MEADGDAAADAIRAVRLLLLYFTLLYAAADAGADRRNQRAIALGFILAAL